MADKTDSNPIASIYTDGACSGNPGPGGWGTVVCYSDGTIEELGGAAGATTNNRMEMQAAIAGLEFYSQRASGDAIKLYTDSEYVKNGITKWIKGWKSKGWKTAAGKPVLNQDLWEELDRLNQKQIQWEYVRGHAGNPGNERCDQIARAFSLGQSIQLRKGTQLEGNVTVTKPTTPKSTTYMETPAMATDLDSILKPLTIAQEISTQGFLITTQEVAVITGLTAATITSRGEQWHWRNWEVSRVREEGGQILWQLERSEV
ncbi:MAG: ribonuclease HI [Alkalinema sp. RU_4_3]|nr:ribonuclease HI [Alkalinema sp. RU_4_3]